VPVGFSDGAKNIYGFFSAGKSGVEPWPRFAAGVVAE